MTRLSFLLLPALLATLAPPARARAVERHFEKSFDVAPGAVLELRHGDGNVTIEPWDQNRIEVTVDYKADIKSLLGGSDPDFTVEFRQEGDHVFVTGRTTGHLILIMGVSQVTCRYAVKAPAWTEIHTKGGDGDVAISGWRAPLDINLSDGNLGLSDVECSSVTVQIEDGDATLEKVTAALDIHGSDGSIRISGSSFHPGAIRVGDGDLDLEACEGDFRIRVDDGNATLHQVRAGYLEVRGGDGHLRAGLLPGPDPQYSIVMDDGDVDLEIPPDTSAAFDIRTDDGSIHVDLPGAADVHHERGSVTGELGGGKGRIEIRTSDGSVHLRGSSI